MRWPWSRERPLNVHMMSEEQHGRTAEAPRGVWVEFTDGSRVDLVPVFSRFEDDGAPVWTVSVPTDRGAFASMGAELIPPMASIEWRLPGLAPWRHP